MYSFPTSFHHKCPVWPCLLLLPVVILLATSGCGRKAAEHADSATGADQTDAQTRVATGLPAAADDHFHPIYASWAEEHLLKPFLRHGLEGKDYDRDLEEFVRRALVRWVTREPRDDDEELLQMGDILFNLRCRELLFRHLYGDLLFELRPHQALNCFYLMQADLSGTPIGYERYGPAMQQMNFQRVMRLYQYLYLDHASHVDFYTSQLQTLTRDAIHSDAYKGDYQIILLHHLIGPGFEGYLKHTPQGLRETITANAGAMPEWIRETVLGYVALERKRPAEAHTHLKQAIKLRSDRPEAAVGMMKYLAQQQPGQERTMKEWMEQALAAQPGYEPAYREMIRYLALGADEAGKERLLEFARACLHSPERGAAGAVLAAADELAQRSPVHWREIYSDASVHGVLLETLQKLAQDPAREHQRKHHRSLAAAVAWQAGQLDLAAQTLDELGYALKHAAFNHLARHGVDPFWMLSETIIHGDEGLRDLLRQAEEHYSEGRLLEAQTGFASLLEKLRHPFPAAAYVPRHRLAAIEIEQQLASGEWVPLQADRSMSAWQVISGNWEATPTGGLTCGGSSVHSIILLGARLGARYEIEGDLMIQQQDKIMGVVLGHRRERSTRWFGCRYRIALGSHSGAVGTGYRSGERSRSIPDSDQIPFRVRVWDGRVTYVVGGQEIVRDHAPEAQLSSPDAAAGFFHEWSLWDRKNFENIRIRRLL